MGALAFTTQPVGNAAARSQPLNSSPYSVDGSFHLPADIDPVLLNTLQDDTTPPSLSWVAPVGDTKVFDVCNQTVQLEVDASDISGINRVVFNRWDYVNQKRIVIETVYGTPYQTNLDASALLPNWNEVIADAYDNAGNKTEKYIWLNHIAFCRHFLGGNDASFSS